MLEDPSQNLCLVVAADRRKIGLSGARSGGRPAAAEEVETEHLVALRIERLARADHLAPPALLASTDVRHGAPSGNTAQRCDQRTVWIPRHTPGDAYTLEAAAVMQGKRLLQLQNALAHGRDGYHRGGQSSGMHIRRATPVTGFE